MCCTHGICILAPGANVWANVIFHPVLMSNICQNNVNAAVRIVIEHRRVGLEILGGRESLFNSISCVFEWVSCIEQVMI